MPPSPGREPDEARLQARPLAPPPALVTPGAADLAVVGRSQALLRVPRPDPAGSTVGLLVVLHGSGGDARQAMDLVGDEAARRGVVTVAPRSTDYTWDALVGGFGPDVARIDETLSQVFATCPVDPARLWLGGFSDGASYALSLGLANGDLFSAVVAFSPGFAAPPIVVGRPGIFVSHGVADRVLPIDRTSRRLVPRLRARGYEVAYHEHDGGHTVPERLVRAAFDGLAASVDDSGHSQTGRHRR